MCPAAAAVVFVAKSEMIAKALQLHIAATRGELPPQRHAEGDPRRPTAIP
jgi:hypothetical protein